MRGSMQFLNIFYNVNRLTDIENNICWFLRCICKQIELFPWSWLLIKVLSVIAHCCIRMIELELLITYVIRVTGNHGMHWLSIYWSAQVGRWHALWLVWTCDCTMLWKQFGSPPPLPSRLCHTHVYAGHNVCLQLRCVSWLLWGIH